MKLIIDIGNTRIKAAIFQQKEQLHFFVFASTAELLGSGIIQKYGISHCIIGTVVNEIDDFIAALKSQTSVLLFSAQTPCPVKNEYKSAHTLGSDRLAAAVGGNFLEPNTDILVIDAGTCIKYNFVNARNQYIGGAISPGLNMRFKALHTFTARLPLLEADENFDRLIGTNSNESILSGVELGAVLEIEGFIDRYERDFNNLKVFLTGGDTVFFAKRLKKRIFADQFLLLKGLNEILDYNLSIK
ncbi:MAG: pantothenate kinase [Bacteroidetes bacterium]|nr:pantothenate kinase [Bacteroidota bacterium]